MPGFPVCDTIKNFREAHSFQKYESLEVYIFVGYDHYPQLKKAFHNRKESTHTLQENVLKPGNFYYLIIKSHFI
jgi:hypothetical protein